MLTGVNSVDVVASLLDISTPWLSDETRAIMISLVVHRGVTGSANGFASSVGARNRHRLSYLLRRGGLPQVELLAAWIRLMLWIVEQEATGTTLCRLSLEEDRDPAYRYRLVKRLTGEPWSKVRNMGLVWVLEVFLKGCRVPVTQNHAPRTGVA